MAQEEILVVDLDGTLIKTDILWESLFLMVKKNIFALLLIPLWLLKGNRSYLKAKLADNVQPDASKLPYVDKVLELVKNSKKNGKEIILASASDVRIVEIIAQHLGLFDRYIGSTASRNLKGKAKLDEIQKLCSGKTFSYIGNDKSDIVIWKASQKPFAVTNSKSIIGFLNRNFENADIFSKERDFLAFFKALRMHQWAKNILIFIPLFLAHQISQPEKFISCLLAFFFFSLCASSLYIINDLFDLDADRQHPKKRKRPFAAGTLSIPVGTLMALVLLGVSWLTCYVLLPFELLLIIILYCASSLFYSLLLKRIMIIDVIGLSAFYSIRIFAGGVAADVLVSPWLIAFSIFFFLCLAFLKRFIELETFKEKHIGELDGRDYSVDDIVLVQTSGISSGFISILVFYLYIANSKVVTELYTRPMFLWAIGPLLIYWLIRMWAMAKRGRVDSDPVFFAVKDKVSWIVGAGATLLVILGAIM